MYQCLSFRYFFNRQQAKYHYIRSLSYTPSSLNLFWYKATLMQSHLIHYLWWKHLAKRHSHWVGLWQAAGGPVLGQVAVLKVDDRLPDDVVFAQEVVVPDRDRQVLVDGQEGLDLKHPGAQERRDRNKDYWWSNWEVQTEDLEFSGSIHITQARHAHFESVTITLYLSI